MVTTHGGGPGAGAPPRGARAPPPIPPTRDQPGGGVLGWLASAAARAAGWVWAFALPAPLVQAPAAPRDGAPSALLVLLPGAFLFGKDYAALIKALQAAADAGGLNLWVAVPPINTLHLFGLGFSDMSRWGPHGDAQLRAAVAAAVAAGFPLRGSLSQGRMDNVVAAMHSVSSGFYGGLPMTGCAAAVMLGAVLDGSVCQAADVRTAPRPLLHVLGQLDGQLRLPRGAWAAAATAPLAAQLGARRFAQERPFAIVPGCNHASFSNGRVNAARGDVPTDVPLEASAEAIAGHIAAFLAVTMPGVAPAAASNAADKLLAATAEAFRLLAPFSEACGRGSPAAMLEAAGTPAADADVASRHAWGNERVPVTCARGGTLMHPGELAAAERFAADAQRRMLAAGMPLGAAGQVHVAVTVHQQVESFIYSQPQVLRTDAGWAVQCHVLLVWRYYQAGLQAYRVPMSPVYSLKLKKGGMVAETMGLASGGEGVVSGAELNEATLAAALAAAPQPFLEASKRGKQLRFGPDRDVTRTMRSPLDWVFGEVALTALEGEEGEVELTTPTLSTPSLPPVGAGGHAGPPGGAAARFAGCHYVKCCSPAWMHEWLMIESLRH